MPAASALQPVAVVTGATVVADGRLILGPVSMTLGPGEHWALLGPNGAGKTTLLSLLGAQRHPTAGEVVVLGGRLGRVDMRELRRQIGVVGHSVADRLPVGASALELVLTGRDGILAPWWGSFDAADRAAALELLERFHCGHLADQRFAQLSQGERQRVLLARSMYGRHRLLLLDEPAVGVDLPGREALVAALDSLASEPDAPATVQVVHTLEELPSSTSHALLLREGRAVAAGPAAEVLADEPLGACFGLAVHVHRDGGRYSARAASSW
ncbi:MAG TPA: ATP-binding cassette domain-containing protein [Acidimicrobiales bacterium]|nr:ATP-binding cassette domain-containing protein [Acidimicrobiales bacterium]